MASLVPPIMHMIINDVMSIMVITSFLSMQLFFQPWLIQLKGIFEL